MSQPKLEQQVIEHLESAVQDGSLSRRDALKFLSLGGLSLTLAQLDAEAATEAKASVPAKGKILIIGGGSGGIDCAARIMRKFDNPDVTLVDPNDIHYYQPGFTLIGCGVYSAEHVLADQKKYIPDGVKWIKGIVTEINADSNFAMTDKGEKLTYDWLILAPGIQINWKGIEGLSKEKLGEDNVHCIYDYQGAIKMWDAVQNLAKTGGKAVFSDINTPIKCGGAPKKINMMTEAYCRREGVRDQVDIEFYTASSKLFGVPTYEKTLNTIYSERNLNPHFRHIIKSIDRQNKEAVFEKTDIITRKEYDDILEEEITVEEEKKSEVRVKFDLLHCTPPMSAPDFVKNSTLSWDRGSAAEGGWAMVDKETLVHMKYKNVIAVGDVAGIPVNKTGGSVRKQAPKVIENLASLMQGKEPSAKHNGYTVCPLVTDYGLVLLAEFGYDGKLLPTVPFLDPSKERWMWWVMKTYILEPLYYHGMLRGIA